MTDPPSTPGASTPRVLIVESRAHVAEGHAPVMFAQLATAIAREGRDVDVLTSRGWATGVGHDDVVIHRLHRLLLFVCVAVNQLNRIRPQHGLWLATAVRDSNMALSARRLCKRIGADYVIVASMATDPWIWSVLIGPRRVLLYQFDPPLREPWRLIKRLAESTERRRRARSGGGVQIVVNSEPSLVAWSERTPWLDATRLLFTGSSPLDRAPGSRERLGLAPTDRVALMFGTPHARKDPEPVWQAFAELPDWKLVIAGSGAADAYRDWRSRQANVSAVPVLFEGFVYDDLRTDLYSAADLAVLSFVSGATSDSATINDAISYGIPVVASSPGFVADAVLRLGIGTVFDAGVSSSLSKAVARAPRVLPADVISQAQDDTSLSRVAREHLALLSSIGH